MPYPATIEKVMKFSTTYGVVHIDGKRHNLAEKRVGPGFEVGDEVQVERCERHGAFIDSGGWAWLEPGKADAYAQAERARDDARRLESETRERNANSNETREWEHWVRAQIEARQPEPGEQGEDVVFELLGALKALSSVGREGAAQVHVLGESVPSVAHASQRVESLTEFANARIDAWVSALGFPGRVRYLERYVRERGVTSAGKMYIDGVLRQVSLQELAELDVHLGPALTRLMSEPAALHETVSDVSWCGGEGLSLQLADLERMEPCFVPLMTFDEVDWTGLFAYPPKRAAGSPDPLVSWDHEVPGVEFGHRSFDDFLRERASESLTDLESQDTEGPELAAVTRLLRWLEQHGSFHEDAGHDAYGYDEIVAQAVAGALDGTPVDEWLTSATRRLAEKPALEELIALERSWCARWHNGRGTFSSEVTQSMLECGRDLYRQLGWPYPERVVEAALQYRRLTSGGE